VHAILQATASPLEQPFDDYVAISCNIALSLQFVICIFFKYASLTQLDRVQDVMSLEQRARYGTPYVSAIMFLCAITGLVALGAVTFAQFYYASHERKPVVHAEKSEISKTTSDVTRHSAALSLPMDESFASTSSKLMSDVEETSDDGGADSQPEALAPEGLEEQSTVAPLTPPSMGRPERRSHLGASGDESGQLSLRNAPPSVCGSRAVRPQSAGGDGLLQLGKSDGKVGTGGAGMQGATGTVEWVAGDGEADSSSLVETVVQMSHRLSQRLSHPLSFLPKSEEEALHLEMLDTVAPLPSPKEERRRSHLGASGDESGELSSRERPPSVRGSRVAQRSSGEGTHKAPAGALGALNA
jgi:hypothetical protein